MNDEMQKELLARLDVLADKMGVTVEYLWGVLVKQAYVDGIRDVIIGVLLLGVAWLIHRYIKAGKQQAREQHQEAKKLLEGYPKLDYSEDREVFAALRDEQDKLDKAAKSLECGRYCPSFDHHIDDEFVVWMYVALWVVVAGGLLFIFAAATPLFNPEYWAFDRLMEMF